MPKVVGKDEKHIRRCSCKHCASILEFTNSEVTKYTAKDYGGGSDTYRYILCPNCSERVYVEEYERGRIY